MTHPESRPPARLPHGESPVDLGHRICTIRRGGRAELRASIVEGRDGEPYVVLRACKVPDDRGRGPWPVSGKVLNLRLEECGVIAEALAGVAGTRLHRDPARLDEIRARTRDILAGGTGP